MTIKKSIIAVAVGIAFSIGAGNVYASGIPVVDVASLSQAIMEYQQQLLDYQQLLSQTGLNTDQLNQLYADYQQTLRNYDQVLREAQGLKSKLSNKDWVGFLTQTGLLDTTAPYRSTNSPGAVESNSDWREALAQTRVLYGLDQNWDEYLDTITNVPYNSDSTTRAKDMATYNYRKAQMATYQQAQVNSIDEGLADIAERARELDERRSTLGDSDSVKTMQFTAEQQQLIIEQNMQLLRATNKDFELSNQMPNEYFNNKAKASAASQKRITESFNKPTVVSEEKIGDF